MFYLTPVLHLVSIRIALKQPMIHYTGSIVLLPIEPAYREGGNTALTEVDGQ